MQHRALHDRGRQVCVRTAIGMQHRIKRQDFALRIEAAAILDAKWIAFTSDDHVLILREDEPRGSTTSLRNQRGVRSNR